MADELKRYWFVAAVFRESHDLMSTIAALHQSGIESNRQLIIANHRVEDTRKAASGSQAGPVPVIAVHGDGAINVDGALKLPAGLRMLLSAMGEVGAPERRGGAAQPGGEGQGQIYQQLREDVDGGAMVLIASVADPDEQLLGARILLRGNCECVLTHEIAA